MPWNCRGKNSLNDWIPGGVRNHLPERKQQKWTQKVSQTIVGKKITNNYTKYLKGDVKKSQRLVTYFLLKTFIFYLITFVQFRYDDIGMTQGVDSNHSDIIHRWKK